MPFYRREAKRKAGCPLIKRVLLAAGKTLLVLVLFFVAQFFSAIPQAVVLIMGGFEKTPGLIALQGALYIGGFLLLFWLVQTQLDKRPWAETGLALRRDTLRHLGLGAAMGLALNGVIVAVLFAAGAAEVVHYLPAEKGWGYTGLLVAAGTIFGLAIGFTEEGLFRGYLIPYYQRFAGWWPAVTVSALLFSAVHLMDVRYLVPTVVIEIALLGLLFALMWRVHGSLWVAVGFHAGWDIAQLFVVGLDALSDIQPEALVTVRYTGTSWLTDPALFGVAGSAVEFLLIPVLTLYYLSLLRRKA